MTTPLGQNPVTIGVTCHMCGAVRSARITHNQLKAWVNGGYIQDVMPQLSAAERELLISGTCGDCFERMFHDY